MEHTVMDDTVMDHTVIEDNNIIVRYVQGTLDADEAASFEEHYFGCPECLEALELSRRLDDGLKGMAAEDRTRWTTTLIMGWLMRRGRLFQSALALCLLAVLALPWLILTPQVARLSNSLQQVTAPQAGGLTWKLDVERSTGFGAGPSVEVVLDAEPEWITLSLELPPFSEATGYRVRILDREDKALWQGDISGNDISDNDISDNEIAAGDGSRGGAPGKIPLRLHSTWLEPGDYAIQVYTASTSPDFVDQDGEAMATYAFRVRVKS